MTYSFVQMKKLNKNVRVFQAVGTYKALKAMGKLACFRERTTDQYGWCPAWEGPPDVAGRLSRSKSCRELELPSWGKSTNNRMLLVQEGLAQWGGDYLEMVCTHLLLKTITADWRGMSIGFIHCLCIYHRDDFGKIV